MNSKKAGWLFLCMIVCMVAVSFATELLALIFNVSLSLAASNFISEMSMFIPALLFMVCTGERFMDMFPIRKIKITTALLVPVYLILIMPLCYFANSITMLFVENTVQAASGQILAMSVPQMILSIGIFAPFIEECCYRGILFQSFKRSTRIIASIVISSLLFGLMHLNLNQAAYAFLLGMMFAILVEATGSLIPSMMAHMLLNTSQVLMLYWENNYGEEILEAAESLSEADTKQALLMAIGPLGVAAVIGSAIAICIAYCMAKNEGRGDYFKSITRLQPMRDENGKKEKVVTIPLIFAMGICLIFIVMYMIM